MNLSNNIDFDLKRFFLWWGRELSFWIPERLKQALSDKTGYVFLQITAKNMRFSSLIDGHVKTIVELAFNQQGLAQAKKLLEENEQVKKAHLILRLSTEQAIKTDITGNIDLLVPIPLHWTRKRWRGFNQAKEICRGISTLINVPVIPGSAFRRVRKTTPQVQLNVASRTSNIRNAFGVCKTRYIKDKNIALVDDVYTTGATSGECARMLLQAGAKSVSLLIIAR